MSYNLVAFMKYICNTVTDFSGHSVLSNIISALTLENLTWLFENNKGANQTVQMLRILISTFVFPILVSIMAPLTTSKILVFELVSVAQQASLNLTKTSFLMSRPVSTW